MKNKSSNIWFHDWFKEFIIMLFSGLISFQLYVLAVKLWAKSDFSQFKDYLKEDAWTVDITPLVNAAWMRLFSWVTIVVMGIGCFLTLVLYIDCIITFSKGRASLFPLDDKKIEIGDRKE